jgi:hypothetical protein
VEILPGCWNNVRDCDCLCNRKTTRLFDYKPALDLGFVWTHKSCVCNERVALNQRHQVDDGARYDSKVQLKRAFRGRIKLLQPVDQQVVIDHASGTKKKLLERARESLETNPIDENDAAVKMFLKDDKYHTPDVKTPRCIQYRNKRYCLLLAQYLIPIESMVYTWLDNSGSPIFAKSRNLVQRGRDIQTKMDYFRDPVAISLDHSKFDAHCNKDLLKMEHWFYNQCFDNDPLLRQLLNWQLVNNGATKNGTTFSTRYTRMSGDQNTGLGNSVINYAMTFALIQSKGIEACYYIDGDDFVIFVERSKVTDVDPKWYEQFGMITKLDCSTSCIEHIEFCQTRPVFDGIGYTMVRNPTRMLSRTPWVVGDKHPKYVNNFLTSLGMCMLSLGMGLPVEQFIGDKLARLGGKYIDTPLHYSANKMFMRPKHARVIIPTTLTRLSYERAWGIPVGEQLKLEASEIVLDKALEPYLDYDEHPV